MYLTTVESWHHGNRIASHERCYSRLQKILDLEHSLDVLDRKPGALRGSTPLAQWRAQGRWPESYDTIWSQLIERRGRQHGTRAMVEVICMGREFGYTSWRSDRDRCCPRMSAPIEYDQLFSGRLRAVRA